MTSFGICHAKKGLLVLRNCGEPATAACPGCGRPVCDAHQVAAAEGFLCPDCAARSEDDEERRGRRAVREEDDLDESEDALGQARHRHHYYRSCGYYPYGYDYYSDYDRETVAGRSDQDAQDEGPAAAALAGPSAAEQIAEAASGGEPGDLDDSGGAGDDLDDFQES